MARSYDAEMYMVKLHEASEPTGLNAFQKTSPGDSLGHCVRDALVKEHKCQRILGTIP